MTVVCLTELITKEKKKKNFLYAYFLGWEKNLSRNDVD